ncbi:MAG TPA: DUF4276 family protein [Blastocatellia bacterium]|jgi:hypothetical protein|nr:DUF4276 family protein [Blastocatellia bacterium]
MSKVLILVEGQTEEAFIKTVLAPHLASLNIFPVVTIITTRRRPDQKDFKDGITSYLKIKTDLRPLLNDSSAALVTTMIDYYGLPHDFPGLSDCPNASCHDRVSHIERAFANDIGQEKFLPYLSLHEFEALLFVSPRHLDAHFPSQNRLQQLAQIKTQFLSPEEINNNADTAPSKRLRRIYPEYQKRTDGPTIAGKIGLEMIRNECRHFNEWLIKLESFGGGPT